MAGLHERLADLEQYPDLESDIIRQTKIHKVLRCIVKLDHIPRDEELKLKERCNNLLYLWRQTPDTVNKQNNELACYDASNNEVDDATKGCVALKLTEPPASRSSDGTEANTITRLLRMLSVADKSVHGLDHSVPGASVERSQNRFDIHSSQNSAQPHCPVDSTTPSILSRLSITDIADLGSLPIPISPGLKQKVRLPLSQLLEPSNVSHASNQNSSDFDSSHLALVKWMLPNATQATAEDVSRLFAINHAAATSFNAGQALHPGFGNRPCQAVRRIVAEWKTFTKAPLTNICIAAPKGDNLTEWEAFMFGPSQSLYAGGVFALSINFPLSYPVQPLKLRFATPLWHPNVTENGDVALNILRHDWCPAQSIDKVLLCVHAMLSDPIGPYDAGVCPDLDIDGRVRMFLEDRPGFEREAREWTRVHAR